MSVDLRSYNVKQKKTTTGDERELWKTTTITSTSPHVGLSTLPHSFVSCLPDVKQSASLAPPPHPVQPHPDPTPTPTPTPPHPDPPHPHPLFFKIVPVAGDNVRTLRSGASGRLAVDLPGFTAAVCSCPSPSGDQASNKWQQLGKMSMCRYF